MLLKLTDLFNKIRITYCFLSYLCCHETVNDLDNSSYNGVLIPRIALLAAFLYRGNG